MSKQDDQDVLSKSLNAGTAESEEIAHASTSQSQSSSQKSKSKEEAGTASQRQGSGDRAKAKKPAIVTHDAVLEASQKAEAEARAKAEAEAKAARAELTGFKDANAVSHQQNMDSMTMTERMIYAASGREKIEDKQILCPKCGMRLDPRAKFCISCGCKLQED